MNVTFLGLAREEFVAVAHQRIKPGYWKDRN
jgi:hypothetical protein